MNLPVCLATPDEVATYRLHNLSPEVLFEGLRRGEAHLLNAPPGVGKSYAAWQLIPFLFAKGKFRHFVVVTGRRDLMAEIAAKIGAAAAAAGVEMKIVVYPDPITDSECAGQKTPDFGTWVHLGLTLLVKTDICDGCGDRDKCRYAQRHDKGQFTGADVVVISDQFLRLKPNALQAWKFGDDTLVVFDEVKGADLGFIHTFSLAHLSVEIEAARIAGAETVAQVLTDLAEGGAVNSYTADLAARQAEGYALAIQRAGASIPGFRNISSLAFSYLLAPLWHEGGVFAVRRVPPLAGMTTLFMGGYLTPSFISARYWLGEAA